ncbi:MAG TPA: maleylpyruvate isomerase N-terminal domain-containing protein, partial [Dehalococcoidia bacterium]|nr:maleylpyruvate isomerase N-terminal domain-containing protein [Dehalococcoidia bacterium]
KKYLKCLPQDALTRPSPCEAWDVGEVIAHLVWFAETYGGMAYRGLHGDISAPEGFPETPGTLSGPAVEELYAKAAIARRRELGEDLLPMFDQQYDWLNEVLGNIGPDDWQKPCYHTNSIRPVEWFPGVIIQELAIHEWDIRSNIEQSPLVSEDSLPCLMERASTRRRPWSFSFERGATLSGPIRYRFELTGPAGGRRDVVVEGDKPRIATEAKGPANLYLFGDAGAFVLMMYDRLTLDSAIATGRFKAEGDLGLVPDFERWLARH